MGLMHLPSPSPPSTATHVYSDHLEFTVLSIPVAVTLKLLAACIQTAPSHVAAWIVHCGGAVCKFSNIANVCTENVHTLTSAMSASRRFLGVWY